MNKLTIIYLLLLFAFFTSSLGEECSDFNKFKSEMCCSVELDDPDKSCVFVNDKCKALPNDCSEYTGSDASECESIVPQTTSEICYFENNSCKSKPVSSCLAYKAGLPREICENIITSEGLKCELVNNECKPSYSDCSDYKGQDKNTCESIELEDFFKYCLYTEGKGCEEKDKTGLTCNSYTGHNSYYCEKIELEDEKKNCVFYGDKCSEYYKECSSITGDTNEDVCNSNIPRDHYKYKCHYKDGQCTKVQKKCSDYKEGEGYYYCNYISLADGSKECRVIDGQCKEVDITQKALCSEYKQGLEEEYCSGIKLEDENKYCVLTNNECKESYKECSSAGNDESICNSIIPENGGKCEFKNNACTEKIIQYSECSEYTSIFDDFGGEQFCVTINPSDSMKKCVYSEHNCNEEDKLCTEFTSGATKEICEKAPTSSNKKKCVLSDDNKSCVEKDDSYFIKAFSSLLLLLLLLL